MSTQLPLLHKPPGSQSYSRFRTGSSARRCLCLQPGSCCGSTQDLKFSLMPCLLLNAKSRPRECETHNDTLPAKFAQADRFLTRPPIDIFRRRLYLVTLNRATEEYDKPKALNSVRSISFLDQHSQRAKSNRYF